MLVDIFLLLFMCCWEVENRTEIDLREALAAKQAAVDAQATAVRELKAATASKAAVTEAVESLNALKCDKKSFEKQLKAAIVVMEAVLVRLRTGRPLGQLSPILWRGDCSTSRLLKSTVVLLGFMIMVLLVALSSPMFLHFGVSILCGKRTCCKLDVHGTPEVVLKASGHVHKFTDLMVKDEKTGTCYVLLT